MSTEFARVADLAEQVRGVSYGKEDASTTPRAGYLPVLRAGNITDDGLTFDDLVFVPAERVSDKQKIRKNDIVIAASSGSLDVVGKAARALEDYAAGFGAFCKVLRPRRNIDPAYFAHFFRTRKYRQTVSALAAGVNINNLRNKHLDDMQIPLPPLPEQRRIAEILDKADALRAKRRAALAQLDILTQSIFLDMFGDPGTNPKGWKKTTLGDLLTIPLRNGLSPSNNGKVHAEVLTLSAITGNGFDEKARKLATFRSRPPDNQQVHVDDFLICRGNGNVHLVGRGHFPLRSMPNITFPDTIIAARISTAKMQPAFLEQVWNSDAVRRQIEGLARTTNGTLKVNQQILEAITFVRPPMSLQREFRDRLASVNTARTAQLASLDRLDALFASLQHRAFQGEL
jgi:type I restriction enzyme S subunit